MKQTIKPVIEPTSYGVRTTTETYGRLSHLSFDWTGKGWAIHNTGMRYTHRGDWIHCPMPSNRTNQFYKRTLWTFEEGMEMFKKLVETLS